MIISPPRPLAVSARHRGPAFGSNPRILPEHRRFIRLATSEYEFWFQPDGDIRFIRGRTPAWPHPAEHLKRTDGNDWVYYWVGEDSSEKGIRSWAGEYYQPCLPYASNGIRSKNYFSDSVVMGGFAAWSQLYADMYTMDKARFRPQVLPAVERILSRDDTTLYRRSEALTGILGERISVLPPDARTVDYDVIPLMIADGCRYRCRFCCVKSGNSFSLRSSRDIRRQIAELKAWYGRNLGNYAALFLGNHDGLNAPVDLIMDTAARAFTVFGFEDRKDRPCRLFLFGSPASLLEKRADFWERLNRLPFHTHINIGFESMDPATLSFIGKSEAPDRIKAGFQKAADLNRQYANIDISGNFLLGDSLPDSHTPALVRLLETHGPPAGTGDASREKGCIYLSPLLDSQDREGLFPLFYELKQISRLPVFFYLIQRL